VKYAILSDVHGNLEALRAVLDDADSRADGVLCLGDTVGYGADPEACVELLSGRARGIVAGNHEYGVADRLDLSWFNRWARAAAEWTRERLDDDHRAWLAALPLSLEFGDATLVHASPAQPDEWEYIVTPEDGWAAFAHFQTRWCFVGHSHVPGVWSLGSSGPDHEPRPDVIVSERGRRYIVNVGSVGQPRDNNPKSAYVIYDLNESSIELRRLDYDIGKAQKKILDAGLPPRLAERLAFGK
jgi:diadenosine tetraphosphatase ApaH/serine/threonine PP2A family protein phosphatase